MLTPPFKRASDPILRVDALTDEEANERIRAARCALSPDARHDALRALYRAGIEPPAGWVSPMVTEPLLAAVGV